MPITFNSEGGFLNGTVSSSNGDLFITTSGSAGSIHIGNQVLTGSQIIEKDDAGKIRNKRTFNADGTITQEKFDQNGKITETKVKNPGSGKETFRSASATTNQIEFQQNSNGAFISVSGSSPGFNVINSPRKSYRLIRETQDQYIDLSNPQFNLWTNGIAQSDFTYDATKVYSGSFVFSPASNMSTPILILSKSGDVRIPGKLYAEEYHTEFISSSILFRSGSTQFGNSHDDTHTFTGTFVNAITASGNISSSGNITAVSMSGDGSGLTNISATVNASAITGSFKTLSASLATRINTEVVANSSTSSFVLNSQTSSFATSEYSSGDISGSFLQLSQSIGTSRALKTSVSGSFTALSSSLTTRINTEVVANSSTSSFITDSQTGSFATSEYSSGDISGSFLSLSSSIATSRALKTTISGSFKTLSASLATRINTTVVANASTSSFLTPSDTGSFLTTSPYSSADISGSFLSLSSSIATSRALKSGISGSFRTLSASLATRINTTVVANASTSSFVLNSQTSSFATSEYSSGDISGSFLSLSSSIATSRALKSGISGSFKSLSASLATRINTEVVANASTSSFVLNSQTGSFLTTSPYSSGDISGSFLALSQSIGTSRALKSGISGSFVLVSSSLASRISIAESELGNTLISSSAQIASNISGSWESLGLLSGSAQIATSISGSFVEASSSFSTRITTAESELGNTLISSSAQITTDISGSFTAASSSFSTRVSANEVITARTLVSSSAQIASDISGSSTTLSSSLASRTTTLESSIDTISTATGSLLNSVAFISKLTGSYAVTGSDVSFGDITADKLIVTQFTASFITSSTIQTEGSNTFGDTSSDTHTFNGEIIAQNDISSSGLITVNNKLQFGADSEIRTVNAAASSGDLKIIPDGDLQLGYSRTDNILIGRPDNTGASTKIYGGVATEAIKLINNRMIVNSNITASGDISASGTGIFNKLEIHGADGTLAADYIIHKDDDNTKFGFPQNDKFKIRTAGTDRYVVDTTHTFTGDIIADSDISASGTIKGGIYHSFGNILGTYHGGSDTIKLANSTDKTELRGTNITISGPVTASGDISSSGVIYGKQIQHTYHQFNNDSNASANYIPAPGGYIVESTSINYYRQWLAPYKGKIKKIVIHAENDCGTTRVSLYHNGVFSGYHQQALGATTAVVFDDFTGGLSGNPDFSQHDLLAIAVDPGNIPGDVNLVCSWEYEIDS
ncbi:MAG: hypothetical protein CMI75_02445 [Candidatus Pelagibacter sp.]|nr:hypothetical protein [Candidatus Pelagibacter sp.]OUT96612.1 MAG: hypothetical protein CBB96_01295 [Gammaproteobacteria bacterium TMED36]